MKKLTPEEQELLEYYECRTCDNWKQHENVCTSELIKLESVAGIPQSGIMKIGDKYYDYQAVPKV